MIFWSAFGFTVCLEKTDPIIFAIEGAFWDFVFLVLYSAFSGIVVVVAVGMTNKAMLCLYKTKTLNEIEYLFQLPG